MSPFSEIMPTAPPYQPRASFSSVSTVCAAAFFGAPITVTAHMWLRNASSESKPSLQNAFHVIHRVEHAGVRFDQPPADHLHRARLADARLVVAVHVRAHRQLGFFFGRTSAARGCYRRRAADRRCAARFRRSGRSRRAALPRARTSPAMRRPVAHRRTAAGIRTGSGWPAARARTGPTALPEYGVRKVWRSTTS